jgi:hypothetical protein
MSITDSGVGLKYFLTPFKEAYQWLRYYYKEEKLDYTSGGRIAIGYWNRSKISKQSAPKFPRILTRYAPFVFAKPGCFA